MPIIRSVQERRAHPRYPTREFGILREVENGVETREQVVYIVNVSAFGAGLELDRPIAVGTSVKIYVAEHLFAGSVIYCRQDGTTFSAGIALSCGSDKPTKLLNQTHRLQKAGA